MIDIKVTANVHKDGERQFTGWVKEIRGVVAQGETLKEVGDELLKMLRCRLMLIFGTGSRPSDDGWYRLEILCNTDVNGFKVSEDIKMH
jgi:hypothetical protein